MSDNITEIPFFKGVLLKKRIIWMTVILLVVCLIVLTIVFWDAINFDALGRSVRYLGDSTVSEEAAFSFDAHNANCYADFHGGMAIGSVSGLKVLSKKGEPLFEKQNSVAAPSVQVSDEHILFYDAGGTTFMLTDAEGKTLIAESVEKTVMDADISPDGCACYCAPAAGHKSVLCVYNTKGSLIYKYKSSSRYLPLCTVSKKAEYAAAVAFSQLDGAFQSFAVVFATDEKEPIYTIALGNQLMYDIEFMPDNTLVCIGEDSLRWMKLDGTLLCNYNYADSYFKDYTAEGDGFLTICLNTNKAGNHYSIVTLDKDGAVLGNLSVNEEVLDFSACGKYVCILTSQNLNVYHKSLELYASTNQISGFTDALVRKDGSVLVVSSDKASVYLP